ncbi:PQQ-like beta-propeller repeat protein [soil metagenome]
MVDPANQVASHTWGRGFPGRVSILFLLLVGTLLVPTDSDALDWPQWRGPQRDGISQEPLPDQLADEGEIVWQASVGTGFSSVSVVGSRLYTMGNEEDRDIIWCLDAHTGEIHWQHRYDCELDPLYFEGGPCATPTVSDGAVYTFSRKGHAFRLDALTGEVAWERNVVADLGMALPEWSFASSPYVEGGRVILNAGGAGLALDAEDGSTVWHSGPETAGYATALPLQREDGEDLILLFGGRSLLGLRAADGLVRWELDWESSREVNAADPVRGPGGFVISSSSGAARFRLAPGQDARPEEIWKHRDLRSYFNAPVFHDGHLYGIHGTTHGPTELVCINWETGETRWAEGGYGSGGAMAAGDRGILFDKGQLTVFKLSPEGFQPLLQQQILGGKCWTVPVWSGGLVYCRNAAGDLAAVRLADE